MSDRKPYITVVTLSTQDNAILLQQLKSSFKRTINWNKYQPKNSPERPNQYLDFLIDSSFQGVNKIFLLSFVNEDNRRVQTGYIFHILIEKIIILWLMEKLFWSAS